MAIERSRTRVLPPRYIERCRVPELVEIDVDALARVFPTIEALCNKCMFHSTTCFMNLVYYMLEVACRVESPKPLEKRP